MALHENNNDFYNYALPTFLEGLIDINDKEIVIELYENDFLLDRNFFMYGHDITIKGCGIDKTRLIFDKDIVLDHDAILNFKGDFGQEINVKFMDLSIISNVAATDIPTDSIGGTRITNEETYVVKCCHVKSLIMHNVNINVENIKTTCLDVRRGYNIDIRNCVFANYNRRDTGGGIWLRGDTENVSIKHCDFYKYGANEVIGIWGSNNFVGVNEIPESKLQAGINEILKKNIHITHNRIYCQDSNGGEHNEPIITDSNGQWSGINERFIAVYTTQDDNLELINEERVQRTIPCSYTINDLQLANNEIFINSPIAHLITVALDKYTTFKDIAINNNIIHYGQWLVTGCPSNTLVLVDFNISYDTVYDYSSIPGSYDLTSDEPFIIKGNTIICGCNVKNEKESGNNLNTEDNHRCLEINGVRVFFDENTIKYTRGDINRNYEINYPNQGIVMFKFNSKGGDISFKNNHCEGIKQLMYISINGNSEIPLANAKGFNNYLSGNPRIIYKNVFESHISLIGNEMICEYPLFLISEFAKSLTVNFIGNQVHRDLSRVPNSLPKCMVFYTSHTNYDDSVIDSLKFICSQNIFDNVQKTTSIYNDFIKINSKIDVDHDVIHTDNIFVDSSE